MKKIWIRFDPARKNEVLRELGQLGFKLTYEAKSQALIFGDIADDKVSLITQLPGVQKVGGAHQYQEAQE